MIVGAVFVLAGCGLRPSAGTPYRMPLQMWGVFDDSDVYRPLFEQYRSINPYVGGIDYRKFDEETYKKELLNALAAGNGPDVFMIRNSWASEFRDKTVPAPEYQLTEKEVLDNFADVVTKDFVDSVEHKIYGLPLSVDSLALYYNKDIFNAAGITAPPKTWQDVLTLVPKLTRIDQYGNINQSAIALGTADNINRAPALLLGLMFGLGADIDAGYGRVDFLRTDAVRKALEFYTLFASLRSGVYTWNPEMHYSIDAFSEGRVAMMVNYSWRRETLNQKNAKLNVAIAPLPYFSGMAASNYTDYWTLVVSKNHEVVPSDPTQAKLLPTDSGTRNDLRIHEAWQLIAYLALPHPENQVVLRNGLTGNVVTFPLAFDPAEEYLKKTNKPAARRDLIEKQRNDPVIGPFALGNLVAKNFPQSDANAIEKILSDMIRAVNKGEVSSNEAVLSAQQRINTIR